MSTRRSGLRRCSVGLLLAGLVSLAGATEDPFEALRLIRPGTLVPAKAFAVLSPSGGSLRLADSKGKVIMLNFWATWCPPCREEMPAIQRLYDRFRSEGFVVLALSIDNESSTVVGAFVREHKLTFPVGLDPKMSVAQAYGARALPSTYLIDRQGRVVAMALGPREWDGPAAHALIRSLLGARR